MLTKLEELEEKISSEGIALVNRRTKAVKAAAIECDGQHAIIYDQSKLETQAERFAALCHEYCHIKFGLLYTVNDPLLIRRKCEYKVKKVMIQKLIKSDMLREKFKNGYTKWEIAEELCITEDVIDDALTVYKNMGEWPGEEEPK